MILLTKLQCYIWAFKLNGMHRNTTMHLQKLARLCLLVPWLKLNKFLPSWSKHLKEFRVWFKVVVEFVHFWRSGWRMCHLNSCRVLSKKVNFTSGAHSLNGAWRRRLRWVVWGKQLSALPLHTSKTFFAANLLLPKHSLTIYCCSTVLRSLAQMQALHSITRYISTTPSPQSAEKHTSKKKNRYRKKLKDKQVQKEADFSQFAFMWG